MNEKMKDTWTKTINWLGDKKWKAYCFGYVFSYIIAVFTMVFRRGDTSFHAFDPFRLIHFVLAYVIGLVLYASTHKYSPEYVKSRVRNVLVVLWIVIMLAAVIDMNSNWGLLEWI